MDSLRRLLHRLFDPAKIAGYVIVSADESGLVRQDEAVTGWGGWFSLEGETPNQFFFHPTWTLGAVRKLTAGWRKRPATAYPSIMDRSTGEVQITGGPFGFWEMATWNFPPGSPIGKAPGQRSRHYFVAGQKVWSLHDRLWCEGVVVSVDADGENIYVSQSGEVMKYFYTLDTIWPHDPY